ncbi:hypothetical protein [Entomospira culicis]|uniref:Uncharacterized protein n=1 Tax=Entomospira culicis TaxID=2719989 RepID=A0A968GFI3_9SPIO|nr:hypothetical protein [Entomospira culicis]NIZ19501.1 hypothetical protein [Entomospira culicis]NIZ69594.1 hypothetical protein [Entomospira culicis]WDI36705.1 hypothetical protein PVA46_05105 [Entomospira culicis]WDI38334.1 hypothetical protein PVA47_05115 [Entomospira culicis]
MNILKRTWEKITTKSRNYSDNILKTAVKEMLFRGRMESMLVLDAMQRESRLIMLLNAILLAFAIYFNDYTKLSKSLAFTIYALLLLRLIINMTKMSLFLYKTRHTGVIYHLQQYRKFGGIFHHKKAFKETLLNLFILEYESRLHKSIAMLHSGLTKLQLTHSQEEIFEYFYKESLITFKKFFFSTFLLLLVELFAYIFLTFLIRQWIFTL